MSNTSVLVLKRAIPGYAEQERRNADMRRMETDMQHARREQREEFPSLENEDGGWGLEDDSRQSPPSSRRPPMGDLPPEVYQEWQDRLQERGTELGATQGRPDIRMPTTARRLGNMPPPITTTMGVDGDIPLPEEMGNFRRPIIRRAFDHAMDMLESRYFG